MPKKKKRIEYRYYDMPSGNYVLPLLGDGWILEYGEGIREVLHFHNYLEIGYCYWGDGELIIEDRIYPYGGEMFTIIPANIPHTTNSKAGHKCKWEFLFIDIEGFIRNEMNLDPLWQSRVISTINKRGTLKTVENHGNMAQIVQNIIRECREEDIFYKESVKGYLYAFVIECMRIADEREKSRHTKKVTEYVKNALEFIEENYAEQITMEEIANAAGLSESHFRRVFEETMNMKPLDYVNMVRIDKACILLAKEAISMEELSYRVGFRNQSTFNRNFKRLMGISPQQWKKTSKGKEGNLKNYNISVLKGWES